ncbi:hypothetical protein C0V72_03615 [Porphyrobacter sp. TH134]|nr:hypothetical protein C0V72_03615 [Porphyrobacter sp. TH134]
MASLAAAPAAAQDGAIWRDDKGRQMVVGFAGGGSPPPAPKIWTAPDMADLFNRLCVAGNGAAEVAKSEAIAAGLTDKSYDMPVGSNQPAWPLIIAQGQGAVLAQADKFLSNPLRQCNVTFYLPQQPDVVAVEQALTALLARPADNDGQRLKKNGKPNKYFSPEWQFPAASDNSTPAFVATFSPVASGYTGIQFSFLAQKDKAK